MKLTKKFLAMLALMPLFALFVACGEDPTTGNEDPGTGDTQQPGTTPGGEEEKYEDIKVVNGMVRFYLYEKENSTRTSTGLTKRDWAKSSVIINGKTYQVELTDAETPRPYVEVAESSSYNATLITSNSNKWYGASTYSDVKLPYSQIRHTAANTIKSFPMYASYAKETGNKLIFNDGFALVMFKLKGTAKISSVKIENPAGKAIAGISSFMPSKGYYTVNKGMDFAVLNCTNKGDFMPLSASKSTNFWVMVAPGNYTQGLKATICDASHLAVFHDIPAVDLKAGDVHLIEMDYAPDADLVFYDGYDNMVWGGDIMKGSESFGFAPTADKVTIDSSADLTGYEEAFAEVAYNSAGTGFIQSNTWAEVNGKTVAQSHRMSDSYIASRNLIDETMMFRTVEFPGYVAVGTQSTVRGIYTSSHSAGNKSIGRVKYTVQLAAQPGFNGNLQFMVSSGGVIESAKVNGVAVDAANITYIGDDAILNHVEKFIPVPKDDKEAQSWSTVEVVVNGATDGTRIYVADENSNSGVHGVYVNSIEGRLMNPWTKKEGTVRVLLWNVLCGMWQDQHNNYDNFVEWVKKWDADICIWCESETTLKDKSTSSASTKYLPDGWAQLCTRYGHIYAAVGGNRDNFPQTLTSKFPIKTVKKITDTDKSGKPVSHGAGHFTIEINGKKLNIVTLHMWPQAYGFNVSGTANQEASAARNEGHIYREHEMQYIVDQTVNNPAYASEEYWILGGDTNSRSRLDAWYHNYADDFIGLTTHDVVLKQTNLKDVIAHRYPSNYFFTSTYANARIDILYASPKMFDRIENSVMLIDNWCYPRLTDNVQGWQYPSDHRPVLVDFDMN